jgi:hypothetical protein
MIRIVTTRMHPADQVCRPANMPKPNMRFLRHIIKDTDTHNKALLAKEAAESKARLRTLEKEQKTQQAKTNPDARDICRRQMGDIQAILGGRKRRKVSGGGGGDDDDEPIQRSSSEKRHSGDRSDKSSKRERDLFRDRKDARGRHGRLKTDHGSDDEEEPARRSKKHESRHRSRRRSGSPRREEDREHRHSRRQRSRSSSPGRRSRSPSHRERKSRHHNERRQRALRESPESKRGAPHHQSDAHASKAESDSDPLEDLIGPEPLPKYRGRGALAQTAGIDRRFSETYDPTKDVMEDDDPGADNWDDAVESFRDLQKLRRHQQERMRDANFTEAQISKVAASEGEKKTDVDVRWSKAGEKREWDIGKSNDDEET